MFLWPATKNISGGANNHLFIVYMLSFCANDSILKNGITSIRVPNEIDAKTISLEKAI